VSPPARPSGAATPAQSDRWGKAEVATLVQTRKIRGFPIMFMDKWYRAQLARQAESPRA
jgi:hypothetical protein